jgi:phosphoenolpyruvate-protein phosphotransferase
MTSLDLLAPLDGWAAPLSEVPDPVFAEKMMGDGLAIDPIGNVLRSPCDGEVAVLHRAHHAVTIRAANGAEILMHIGLETVALAGKGFTPKVKEGDKVKAGDPLIEFDLDAVAKGAKDLITPVIVTNHDEFVLSHRKSDCRIGGKDVLMRLRRLVPQAATSTATSETAERKVTVPLPHGLHARPAARVADLAKGFSAEISVKFGDKQAKAKSPVAVMGLGVGRDGEITLIAAGADAKAALDAIAALIEGGMGEKEEIRAAVATQASLPGRIGGVRAAPGLALGAAVRLTLAEIAVEEKGSGDESEKLHRALHEIAARLRGHADGIMAAHLGFIEDPELLEAAERLIGEGKSAGFAWRSAIAAQIAVLRQLSDPRFVERIADLKYVERQVLLGLGGTAEPAMALPKDAILIADDLLPSQLIGLEVAGIATVHGGPTSHVAIMAASKNIPALVACGPELLQLADGAVLFLDADAGHLHLDPDVKAAKQRIAERQEQRAAAQASAFELCRTKDGERIEIAANLGSLEEAKAAVAAGAEGCGLLRSEFLFLERDTPPDEAEQAAVYGAIAKELGERPLIIRTLDIGGDKPAPYLPIPPEENPALGLRGVRVSLWKPELLDTQLRAIVKSVPAKQCRIMIPMIASLAELRKVRAMLPAKVQLGVMVETPAAAITSDLLAAEADFLSIGTNDLTQYTLAMDRGNASVAAEIDAMHPAVLRMIFETCKGAGLHGKWVGVCGGLASDLAAAPILIGLGVKELSATASQVADLKAKVRGLTLPFCRDLAERALACSSAQQVRALAGEA